MSTSRYCSPTSRATEPGTGFGPVLHISTKSALIPNRQNGSWRPASPHGWYTPRKGDGGLTESEHATLDAAPLVTVVTIPGAVFFLPDEAPRQIAEVTAAALKQASGP
jgi:hypothetical protein